VELIERFAFYDLAKTAFAVVATGYVILVQHYTVVNVVIFPCREGALYGNIILQKGVIAADGD